MAFLNENFELFFTIGILRMTSICYYLLTNGKNKYSEEIYLNQPAGMFSTDSF